MSPFGGGGDEGNSCVVVCMINLRAVYSLRVTRIYSVCNLCVDHAVMMVTL